MPYVLKKKNGKRTTQFTLYRDDVERLSRDPRNCYTVVAVTNPERAIRVGGRCKTQTPSNLWGARRRAKRKR